jgi:hypothetical protein
VEGAVSVALAASGSSVGEGTAGVQAARKNNMDTIQLKTLVNMLNSSSKLSGCNRISPATEKANS